MGIRANLRGITLFSSQLKRPLDTIFTAIFASRRQIDGWPYDGFPMYSRWRSSCRDGSRRAADHLMGFSSWLRCETIIYEVSSALGLDFKILTFQLHQLLFQNEHRRSQIFSPFVVNRVHRYLRPIYARKISSIAWIYTFPSSSASEKPVKVKEVVTTIHKRIKEDSRKKPFFPLIYVSPFD